MFEGKKIFITGGTGSIGNSICRYFKLNKCNEIFASTTNLEKVNKEDNFINFKQLNLSEISKINLEEKLDLDIDFLVLNAGVTKDNIFLRMSEQEWEDVLNINLNSTFNILKLITKGMVKRKYGRIINISSVVGATGGAGQVNYAASKAGLIGLTKSLSQELATRNITVNCIAPGFIETPMTEKLDDNRKDIIISSIPANRIGTPKDLSSAVIFLASQESSYITGQTIHINGGLYMN